MIFNLTGNLTGRVEAVPPAAGGNAAYTKDEADAAFAPLSHVSDPTVHHTASEIGDIAAAKVAAVVADAPDNLDTLKEIADVIGTESGQAAAGILKRVADLETGKASKDEMSVTPGTGANAGKTTIWLKDGTSATVLTEHQDVSGKLDGAAAYPAWQPEDSFDVGAIRSYNGRLYQLQDVLGAEDVNIPPSDNLAFWGEVDVGTLKQDALSPAQMAAVNSGATSAKVATWDGYASQKASLADLPYALVTPGEWTFSDGQSHTVYGPTEGMSGWFYMLDDEQVGDFSNYFSTESEALAALSLTFLSVTATRPSLPGHLFDRAVNAVSVSGDTTLTLPALVNAGKARDFLVRLAISGSTVPTITFAAPTGETITYETDGDEFPAPDEAGTWLYSFTETAAGVFDVSLKKVNTVAQGGS